MRFITLLCVFILSSSLLAGEYLVLMEDLDDPQQYYVIDQIQNKYFALATKADISAMQKRQCHYKILDHNPSKKMYYLVFPVRETREMIAKVSNIVAEFDDYYLVWVTSETEDGLFDLTSEFNYMEQEKMIFQTHTPPELLNTRITNNPIIQKIVNSVSIDTLESFIRHLQEIPSRHVNYKYLETEAVPWLCKKLKEYGCDSVYTQEVPRYNAPNVIGIKLGAKYPSYTKYYLIGGHPDAQPRRNPNYGADDNATGTAAFLETARVFKDYTFDYTIVFMAFNAEEVGLHGSRHYAKVAAQRGDSVLSVLNMERCAHVKDVAHLYLTIRKRMPSTKTLADLYMKAAETYKTNLESSYNPVELTNSDHASFWNKGYTAIMCKEKDEPPVYHTVQDTLFHPNGANNLEFHTSVVKTGVATMAELAKLSPTFTNNPKHNLTAEKIFMHGLSGKRIMFTLSSLPTDLKKVTIFNAKGHIIKNLPIKFQEGKSSSFIWDGKNHHGNPVPVGVYYIDIISQQANYSASFLVL